MCAHTIFLFFVQLAHIHMSLVPIRIFDLMFDIKDTGFPMLLLQEISTLEILVDFHLRNWIFLVRNFDQHEISPKSRFRNLKLISALRHICRTYLYIFIKLYMMCTHQAHKKAVLRKNKKLRNFLQGVPVVRITYKMLRTFQEYFSNIKEPQRNKIVTYYKVLKILSKKKLWGGKICESKK